MLQLLKKEPGQISFPLDFRHTITVQPLPIRAESHLRTTDTPPGSPGVQRLRAIARKLKFDQLFFCQAIIFFFYYYLNFLFRFYKCFRSKFNNVFSVFILLFTN